MGWAKYYEDNMSIYVGRMAVRERNTVFYEKPEIKKAPEVKIAVSKDRQKDIKAKTPERVHKTLGRKGLKLVFQNGADEGMIRKMQMNGWWWSKTNACWYNHDTKGNRKYAKALKDVEVSVSSVL